MNCQPARGGKRGRGDIIATGPGTADNEHNVRSAGEKGIPQRRSAPITRAVLDCRSTVAFDQRTQHRSVAVRTRPRHPCGCDLHPRASHHPHSGEARRGQDSDVTSPHRCPRRNQNCARINHGTSAIDIPAHRASVDNDNVASVIRVAVLEWHDRVGSRR